MRFDAVLFDCDGVLVDSEPITNGVLRDMLIGLGATVTEISEPFSPMDGAYAHDHSHALLNR